MKLQLYSQFDTDIVTDTSEVLRLPSGYTEFDVHCSVIKQTDASDVLAVDKTTVVEGVPYQCRTHVSTWEFLYRLAAANPCCSTSVMDSGLGPKPRELECLVDGAHIWADERDDIYFCFQGSPGGEPVLYSLRLKYYSADLRLFAYLPEHRRLRAVYGCLRSDVFLPAVGQRVEIDTKELLWFKVPQAMLLWNNMTALAQEDGSEFWCENHSPLLPRFRRLTR